MGLLWRVAEKQQLGSQQDDDACDTGVGFGSVASAGPQQLGSQQDAPCCEGAPSTCNAVRAYLALTSCRNCSSLWGTLFIRVFLSISHHEQSTLPFSIAFA
jgi:hypothetical protein